MGMNSHNKRKVIIMYYCSGCGVKHKLSGGIIFEDDRTNYEWNCNLNSDNITIQEEILANFLNSKSENSILLYE